MMHKIPTWNEVLDSCIHAPALIRNFNHECACSVIFDQLPDLVNNHQYLKGNDRIEIDLLVDYILNFVYLPILFTNDFERQHIINVQKDEK